MTSTRRQSGRQEGLTMRTFATLRVAAGAMLWLAANPAQAESISLERAVQRAAKRSTVAMAAAERDAVRSEASDARRSPHNPELGVAAGPRFAASSTFLDAEVSIAQTVELGGKRAARRDAADARIRAASADLELASHQARLDAWRAFQLALVARQRLETTRDAEQLAAELAAATRDIQALGAGTQLQINLTTAEVGRARHDRIDAENQYQRALAELATAVGAGANERLEPAGALASLPAVAWTEAEALTRALRSRPEITAAAAGVQEAQAEARLATALGRPDITLGVRYGYQEEPDITSHAVVATAAIALPVRNRNQGGRGAAQARQRRAEIDRSRLRTEVEREVRVAVAGYQRARDAVLGFDQEVNERLHENLELARESFQAGKINFFEFNVVRRELVANRLAYLDAVAEAIEGWHAMQRAVGGDGQP
jgi:cobalt-zinc-cadmium efflux system outer membrane protein